MIIITINDISTILNESSSFRVRAEFYDKAWTVMLTRMECNNRFFMSERTTQENAIKLAKIIAEELAKGKINIRIQTTPNVEIFTTSF